MVDANQIMALADQYEYQCSLLKLSFIRRLPNGKWRVVSRKGKNLGTFDSKEKAVKHLQEVEYFKHLGKKASNDEINLTDIDNLSYSAIMRELRKQCEPNVVKEFLKLYKICFDSLMNNEIKHTPEIALICALQLFSQDHLIKLKIEKKATIAELGEANRVGHYLADIIKFTLNRIKPENRSKAMHSILRKLYFFNVNEIANKVLPASSAIGQAITFVKNVLFNQPPEYIREVINSIGQYLR